MNDWWEKYQDHVKFALIVICVLGAFLMVVESAKAPRATKPHSFSERVGVHAGIRKKAELPAGGVYAGAARWDIFHG